MSLPVLRAHRTEIDGVGLAWQERPSPADAGTIVFLHGLGASSRDFVWLAADPNLADRRLLLIDAAGFGASGRPPAFSCTIEAHAALVARLLAIIGATPLTLVGHSTGGSIGIALAHTYPSLVERLIVAEPNLDPGAGILSGHIARQPEARFVARGYPALVYQTERAAARGDMVAAAWLPSLREASPVAMHRSAVSLRADRAPTFRAQLASLARPRTMLWGERSPPLDPPLEDPAVRQITIPAAGHQLMTDNPAAVAAALRDALDHRSTSSSS